MAFQVSKGKTKEVALPVTASTAISAGALLTFSSGRLVAATAGTTAANIVGVLKKTIAATDDDYASTRDVSVIVPVERHVEWEADVTSGLVAADVGLEQDLTDASTVNRGASSVDVVKCQKVLSSTKGIFLVKINGSY